LTKTREELDAEKRDSVRTNERLSQELEYSTVMKKCVSL
jgi:nucleoprotein TPR